MFLVFPLLRTSKHRQIRHLFAHRSSGHRDGRPKAESAVRRRRAGAPLLPDLGLLDVLLVSL